MKNEKLQYNIHRETTQISALSSGRIFIYIYIYIYTLHVKKVLPSYQRQIIEQTKFTYLPLGKSFGKQTKIIENKGNQQREAAKKQGAALNGA